MSKLDEWPKGDLEELSACPICQARDAAVSYSDLTDRVYFCAPGLWNFQECSNCDTVFLNPRPTPSTIARAYAEYFTHGGDEAAHTTRRFKLRWVRDAIGNGYRNARFGTTYQPSLSLGRWVTELIPSKALQITAEGRLGRPPFAGAKLLDIGCADGNFLLLAKSLGWSVEGIDFDSAAVSRARSRGLSVREGSIKDIDDRDGVFDAITLNHVIEHLHDPVGTLSTCKRLLAPSGILWIETPNVHSVGRKIFQSNWFHLDPPRHLVLFNERSLKHALQQSGFRLIETQRHVPRCLSSFAASQAIAEGRDPRRQGTPSLSTFWRSLRADRFGRNNPAAREVITVIARG